MNIVRDPARRAVAAGLVAVVASLAALAAARAADLPRYEVIPAPRVVPAPVYGNYDPGPASDHGYYGYYGFDIAGTPYNGLYSANVLCLRSVSTPWGYRTVNICQP